VVVAVGLTPVEPLTNVDVNVPCVMAIPVALLVSQLSVLVGYTGAFRRSELADIVVADLSFSKNGLVIDLRRSKTDREASLSFCLDRWAARL
jgi:hypothetical protein